MRVLAALREENQAQHWLGQDHPDYQRAKRRLTEAFVPTDPGWRDSTLRQAVELLDRSLAVLERR
jgi:hypothetical protein